MSTPALVTTGVMHIALLWLVLQSVPAVPTLRSVVQYLAPITLLREKPPTPTATPIRVPKPTPVPIPKAVSEPVLPVPVVVAPKVIELPPEKPVLTASQRLGLQKIGVVGLDEYAR